MRGKGTPEISWQQDLWDATQATAGWAAARGVQELILWLLLGQVDRALISGVIRLEALTLGEFTLNLVFIVS